MAARRRPKQSGPPAPAVGPAEPNRAAKAAVRALLAWYGRERRSLPWREQPEPYYVWISEIMLQQTRMETAVPRWQAFIGRFPTIEALANAAPSEVADAWAGLGYYSRARNLHRAAGVVMAEFGGQLPKEARELLRLPGIGPYTAGAIASIAFNEPAPLVDGNVERVLARLDRLSVPYHSGEGRQLFWAHAEQWVRLAAARGRPGDFNQALMELGARICLPRAPRCLLCPLQSHCQALAHGEVAKLPVASPKTKQTRLDIAFVLHWRRDGLLVVRRPPSGLWAGLWEPPSAAGPDGLAALRARGFRPDTELGTVEHVLTHRLVRARVFVCSRRTAPAASVDEERTFVAEPAAWPMSRLAHRAVALAPPRRPARPRALTA